MCSDYERVLLLDHTLRIAEDTYDDNPLDADNLAKWGSVLVELSQYQDSRAESKKMVQDAIDKLEEALDIDPKKHEALFCLGKAHMADGYLISDVNVASKIFDKATRYFEQAYELEPQDELYKDSLERVPRIQSMSQQAKGPGPSSSTNAKKRRSKKSQSSDLKYDICGWIILAVVIVAWMRFAKSNVPPFPPRY